MSLKNKEYHLADVVAAGMVAEVSAAQFERADGAVTAAQWPKRRSSLASGWT